MVNLRKFDRLFMKMGNSVKNVDSGTLVDSYSVNHNNYDFFIVSK